jgi:ATP/maltotriose-dependent transcriptional regulator MalT
MYLHRERLHRRLVRAATFPVALLVAPEGFGKSYALRRFHRECDDGSVVYEVSSAHTSLTRFVRGLAAALEPTLPTLSQSLAIAHERAIQSSDAPDVLAGWLAQHLGTVPRTILIDDYHHCEREPAIAAFLAGAVDRTRAHVRWVVATRSSSELPFATWFARGDAQLPVDEIAFRLTESEAVAIAAEIAPALGPAVIPRLLEATRGSIGKLCFALATAAADPGLAERVLDAGGDAYEHFAEEALAALETSERKLLLESVFFPDLDDRLFAALGHPDTAGTLQALQAKLPLAFVERGSRWYYSPLFGATLAKRVADGGARAVRIANLRTAEALERAGRITEALAFYIRGQAFEALARTIEAHGFQFVGAGYGEAIGEAIDALDPMAQMASPVILAIKAMFESRLGRFDTAESWFQLSIDRTTDAAVRDQITYEYGTHLLRFIRPEATLLLEQLAAKPDTSEDLRCYALAALGPSYVFARRFDDAARSTNAALELLAETSSPHLRSRAFHQAAYVALFRGEGSRAKELASISLAIATEHGFFDVSAGALTVLYNVASDVEDDTFESVRLLEAVADCAAKSGSLTNHLFALIARLELEVERGNEDSIDELDEKLRTIDITCSGRAAYEALLPSQALRASWSGDFAGAYRLLAASAAQQWSSDRKALRWAEIAVYAAAAGLSAEAAVAFNGAMESLEGLDVDIRVQRARLFLALALVLLGRSDSARELFEAIDAAPRTLSPRLHGFRRVVGILADRYRGVSNAGALLAGLKALKDYDFGGFARMLMCLPMAENASLRLPELSSIERRTLSELVAGNIIVSERRVDRVIEKLGCTDVRSALRAVTRYSVPSEAGTPDQSNRRAATV